MPIARQAVQTPLLNSPGVARLLTVFRGPNGVRLIWSLLIFIAICSAAMLAARFAIFGSNHIPDGPMSPRIALSLQAAQLATAVVATSVMAWIEGRSFWSYGLASRRWLILFGAGWIAGLASLSALIGLLHQQGYLAFDGVALRAQQALFYGAIWTIDFAMVGMAEEMLNRGYLLTTLARTTGFWPAAILSSLFFAAGHLTNQGENILGIVQVVAAGLAWCLLLRVTDSLWLGIGFHAAWDWAQSYLYGTPDSGFVSQGHLLATHPVGAALISGGNAGPEGSLLAVPVFLAGALLLAFVASRIKTPTSPPKRRLMGSWRKEGVLF